MGRIDNLSCDGEDGAGFGAGGFAGVPDESAVDENLFYAGGEFEGFFEGGAINDGVGIEEDKVSVISYLYNAAVFPVEALGGERGHFADGLGQSDPFLFPHEETEDARKGASSARMF